MEIDDKLKNRLAGTAVITVLAVIFLPMLFDDPVQKKAQVVSELDIPHKPEVSPLLNTAIIPDKNAEALSKAELTATNPAESTENLTDESTKTGNELESETPPSSLDTAAQEEESPAPVKKKPAKKPAVTADDSKGKPKHSEADNPTLANKKAKEQKKKELKPAELSAAGKKPSKPKAELPVLDPIYQDKNTASAPKLDSPAALNNRRWVVQVASLTDQAKANAFRDKLRSQGFPATIDSVWLSGKGRVYRLKVGPELNAEKAQAMKTKINQLNNVSSIAVAE